eukprot:406148_1
MGSHPSLQADPTQQDHVTTSASTMERILSDDRIAIAPHNAQLLYPQHCQQNIQNAYIPQQQYQPYVPTHQAYPNAYGYQQSTVPQPNALPNSTPQQLQLELQQQMQQLHLLQQAQQLERQRLDLARLQRDLEAQSHKLQQQAHQDAQMKAQAIEEKYPVVFHWQHGGRVVYVAYSGDNWSHKYRMHRSHNDFSLIMEIRPGVYHYKFIVDNQWRCARNQKHVRDGNGAYSNVLDVMSHSYQRIVDGKEHTRKREKHYTQNTAQSDHYVQDPPICPIHLHHVVLNGDEDDDDLGSDKHDDVGVKAKTNTMELPKPLRVSLNHLYVSDDGSSREEEDVATLGMTERYKDKFFTTVYYTPIRRCVDERSEMN